MSVCRVWMLLAGLLVVRAAAAMAPPFEVIRDGLQPSNVLVTDHAGRPLAEDFRPYEGLRLEWTPLRALPQDLVQTLLMAEDRRFYQHAGVDWRAFVAALWQNLWSERMRGASTVTMQLAGLLDPALRPRMAHGGRRTIGQKWDQTQAAAELEAHWSKEQILEAYLNLAYFRGQLQGIAAASQGVFGKAPALLGRAEGAILAVLLRAPDAPAARVRQRACRLLQRIDPQDDCGALQAAMPGLEGRPIQPRWSMAEALLERIPGGGGQRVQTTLDAAWQARLVSALSSLPEATRPAALLVDGEARLRAYAARSPRPDPWREPIPDRIPRALLAISRALDAGRLGPESLLAMPAGGADLAWRSLRAVLAEAPLDAVAGSPGLFSEGELEAIDLRLAALASTEPGAQALDLAALLSSLSGDGLWRAPRWRDDAESQPPARPLVSRAAAFIFRDSWIPGADGCSRRLIVAEGTEWSLLGLSFGELLILLRTEGAAAAGQARALADRLAAEPALRDQCVGAAHVPPGVVQRRVRFDPPLEAPRTEWLLASNPTEVSRAGDAYARIAWPRTRSIVDGRAALKDPEFRVSFVARPAAFVQWRLNGVPLGRGSSVAWRPVAGLHRLELLTDDGRLLDSVEFAARGPL